MEVGYNECRQFKVQLEAIMYERHQILNKITLNANEFKFMTFGILRAVNLLSG
jgi:hypothetical protein